MGAALVGGLMSCSLAYGVEGDPILVQPSEVEEISDRGEEAPGLSGNRELLFADNTLWEAAEDCQCVPSANILQSITYGVIKPVVTEESEQLEEEAPTVKIDFGKLVRAGYFTSAAWKEDGYLLSQSFYRFKEVADLYNTQVDVIIPYASLKNTHSSVDCSDWSYVNEILTAIDGKSDGITLDFGSAKVDDCIEQTVTLLRTRVIENDFDPLFKINLMIDLHALTHLVEDNNEILLGVIEKNIDYILVTESTVAAHAGHRWGLNASGQGGKGESSSDNVSNPIGQEEQLVRNILSTEISPTIYSKIIPLFSDASILEERAWAGLEDWLKGYRFLGLGLIMEPSHLEDLSVLRLERNMSNMDDIKRLQFQVCPQCCNVICPYQNQIRSAFFAVIVLVALLIAVSQVSITTTVWMKNVFGSVVVLCGILFAVFEGLMICDPWFQDSRDFSAAFSVFLIAAYIVYSAYKRKRVRDYP